jgi:hypothetical protein
MSRDPNCATCGHKIRNDICTTCIDTWSEYKAEMDTDFWAGSDDQ